MLREVTSLLSTSPFRRSRGFKLEWTKTGASLILPNKRRIDVLVKNNCPYANKEVLEIVKKIRDFDEKARHKEKCYVNLLTVAKTRLRSQGELDEHRRQGHVKYSPDCPECVKREWPDNAHTTVLKLKEAVS